MSTTATSERPLQVAPVMGPLARVACRLDVGGRKRLKVLTLIAAFADAGVSAPSSEELLGRLPDVHGSQKLYGIVRRLADDGFLRQLPKGRGFELLFLDGDVGGGE